MKHKALINEAHFEREAPRVASEAVEKLSAREVSGGRYDLVLDPLHLALTIHESCGHATELDRALGYEANFAGTSPPADGKHLKSGSNCKVPTADF